MSDTVADHGIRSPRIAWLVSLAIPVLLMATLAMARSAQALTVSSTPFAGTPLTALPQPNKPVEAEDEGENEDWENWEEGEWEEEEEEPEDERGNPRLAGGPPPPECLLRSADAKAVIYTAQDKADLVIRYTSFFPAEVTVDYRLRGGKGSLLLGGTTKYFAKQGVFRQAERLNKAQAAKARAAKDVTVQLRLPEAPSECGRSYTRHLTIKRTLPSQVSWLQSDSIFGN